LQITFHTANFI